MSGPMISRLINILLLCIACAWLAGCDIVYTEQPIGATTAVLDKEIWQGTWLNDEVVMLTTVLDAEKGLLQAAWVERGPDGARFESYTGTVRHSGSDFYLTIAEPASKAYGTAATDTDEQVVYVWAKVAVSGQKAMVWLPDVEQFINAVREQSLPGIVTEGEEVVLSALDASHQARIANPESGLMQWSDPLVFVRIGD